jgi:hypothetical protein
MEEERTSYKMMRDWAMDSAYETCRSIVVLANQNGFESVEKIGLFANFFNEDDDIFSSEIEMLMWHTLCIILNYNHNSSVLFERRSQFINKILSHKSFENLVSKIPENEANELRQDLKLLKFIE